MPHSRVLWIVGIAWMVGAGAGEQTAQTPPPPEFEVVSVKPSAQALTFGPISPDRFVRRNITLSLLLVYAYELSEFQIQGGPDWVRNARFEVEAKADKRPTREQMRLMVRRLLGERFGLRVHTETRDLPRYALVKARSDGRLGEKLRPSPVDCRAMTSATNDGTLRARSESGDRWLCAKIILRGNPGSGSVTLTTHGYPISDFARNLRARAGPAHFVSPPNVAEGSRV
jgi:uncharacterized protein (TIGR03435 family)